MLKTYDTVILGCGEAGVFAGYELIHRNPGMKVLIVDQGQDIYHRSCPIVAGKVKSCIDCKVCHTMCGFGGAGAFSDGKYNFTTAFGGWLTDFIPEKEVMDLIDYVDEINTAHGATREVFSTNTPEAQALRKRALESDLHLLQARVKHLGTENNLRILTNIYEDLRKNIDFQFNTAVTEIRQAEGGYLLETANGDEYLSKYLIAAPGRSGAEWFAHQCQKLGLPMTNNQIDIGVRVELPALVFEHITDVVYESKLIYRTKQYGDQVRTFCMNPYGHVVSENVEGIHTVNGHSYSDPKLRSENTNFALLVSNHFTEPFNEPYRYGKHIASLSNMLAGGVLVQRFGDLIRGVRSNAHRMSKSTTHPTLTAAVPGDLSLALPKRQLDDIIEMIYALDKLAPGRFASLQAIHKALFEDIYDFAGELRTVNLAKGNFRFAPLMYLQAALENIDKMPQSNFDEIVEKYVEMNIAHPFREGNGRSTRIWLDHILKNEIGKVVDWSKVDKEDYLLAMERSPIKDIEIKHLLKAALTDKINSREVYMKGIDHSYYYEGYTTFKTEEL